MEPQYQYRNCTAKGGIFIDITVQIRLDVSLAVQGKREPNSASNELMRAIKELGINFAPLHPSSEDPSLARYFRIEVPTEEEAQRVIMRLKAVQGVEAAYIKPPDEPA
jgi:hypothetical protein